MQVADAEIGLVTDTATWGDGAMAIMGRAEAMDMEAKPVPHPDRESQPYWDGAAEGKLRLQRCTACGKFRNYPQLVCPDCYSLDVEWIEASGQGTVHSWTVATMPSFRRSRPICPTPW